MSRHVLATDEGSDGKRAPRMIGAHRFCRHLLGVCYPWDYLGGLA